MRRALTLDQYTDGIRAGETSVLARAITLAESQRADHQTMTQELLTRLMPFTGGARRVGITGVPGVGKSTLIDALGLMLTGQGYKVAVLAVDPTSSRSGGSILGDKTRMARLATDPKAFIRPSPSSGVLGGVGRMTRETMLLCEAAGFDVVIVETVGTGQSETVVAGMVDFFLVLALPGAGDELQGIKKGIIELADMVAVTKADGENKRRAMAAKADYTSALHILAPASPLWSPPVLTVAALEDKGLAELWAEIERHRAIFEKACALAEKRRAQQVGWMRAMLEARVLASFKADPAVKPLLRSLEAEVERGRSTPVAAVERIMAAYSK